MRNDQSPDTTPQTWTLFWGYDRVDGTRGVSGNRRGTARPRVDAEQPTIATSQARTKPCCNGINLRDDVRQQRRPRPLPAQAHQDVTGLLAVLMP